MMIRIKEAGMISSVKRSVIAALISLIFFSGFAQSNTVSSSTNIDKARAKLSAVAEEVCLNSLKKITAEMEFSKEAMEAVGGQLISLKAKELSVDLTQAYKNAFILNEAEAEKIVTGKFDDAHNNAIILESVKKMATLKVSLPEPIQYLIDKSSKQTLSGIEGEFTARLFTEYLKQQGK